MKYNARFVYNVRNVVTIRQLLESSFELFPNNAAFLYHEQSNVVEKTYKAVLADVKAFSTYLNQKGLEGKIIAVTGKNCYEWALIYLAVACGTGIIMPVDKDLREDEIDYLLRDSGAAAIVYSSEVEEKILKNKSDCIKMSMDNMGAYLDEGNALLKQGDLSYLHHRIDPYALGILLYTSGTTGVAKGVMLSQNNICSNIVNVCRMVHVSSEDRVLSVLPLHHTYECMAGFLSILFLGGSIAYNRSLKKLQADFLTFRPTIFIAVPLILESLRKMIIKKYSKIFGGNMVLNAQRTVSTLAGPLMKAKKLVFNSVNAAFGGRLRLILSGAAPLSPETFRDYERFGIKTLIGYGLTETSPVCIMHSDFYRSADDIGYPIVGVQAKISDPGEDGVGELAVKGPNVMLGYYNNPEETQKVMKDGWFYTGDLAKQKQNGAFQITGRLKSMIVLPSGKKVFPEEFEYYLMRYPYVGECMVYGVDGENGIELTVSIYPNTEEVDKRLVKDNFVPDSAEYNYAKRNLFENIIREVNEKFPKYKHIRRVILRDKEFEKTTTRKIKRTAAANLKQD